MVVIHTNFFADYIIGSTADQFEVLLSFRHGIRYSCFEIYVDLIL